jgi:hypothetical protein
VRLRDLTHSLENPAVAGVHTIEVADGESRRAEVGRHLI